MCVCVCIINASVTVVFLYNNRFWYSFSKRCQLDYLNQIVCRNFRCLIYTYTIHTHTRTVPACGSEDICMLKHKTWIPVILNLSDASLTHSDAGTPAIHACVEYIQFVCMCVCLLALLCLQQGHNESCRSNTPI